MFEFLLNKTSSLVGSFISSPREKRENGRASRGEEREKQKRMKEKVNGSADTRNTNKSCQKTTQLVGKRWAHMKIIIKY